MVPCTRVALQDIGLFIVNISLKIYLFVNNSCFIGMDSIINVKRSPCLDSDFRFFGPRNCRLPSSFTYGVEFVSLV